MTIVQIVTPQPAKLFVSIFRQMKLELLKEYKCDSDNHRLCQHVYKISHYSQIVLEYMRIEYHDYILMSVPGILHYQYSVYTVEPAKWAATLVAQEKWPFKAGGCS